MKFRQILALVLACLIWQGGAAAYSEQVSREIKHVIVVSIDGLRQDVVTEKTTPALWSLKEQGAWAPGARCVSPSRTVPNHVSMVTGLHPYYHKYTKNKDRDYPPRTYVPDTIFQMLGEFGISSALYVTKRKLRILANPNVVQKYWVQANGEAAVSAVIEDIEAKALAQFVFLHLAEPDRIGHQHNWMSVEYLKAVRGSDVQVGRLVQVLKDAGLFENTVLLVTSDHGGIQAGHSQYVDEVAQIPWILVAPGIPEGLVLESRVSPMDIMPLAGSFLGLFVREGEDRGELLTELGSKLSSATPQS